MTIKAAVIEASSTWGLSRAEDLPSLPEANGTVAVVITLSGTATLISMLFSALLLRDVERVTRGVLLGALLVVVGVSLISLY